MKKLQGIMLAGILVFLAAAGFFWWAFLAPAGTVFQLVDRNRDQVVLSVPVKAGDKLSLEIKPYKRKRSLDANRYYWALLTKLAGILGTSNAELHNILLSNHR